MPDSLASSDLHCCSNLSRSYNRTLSKEISQQLFTGLFPFIGSRSGNVCDMKTFGFQSSREWDHEFSNSHKYLRRLKIISTPDLFRGNGNMTQSLMPHYSISHYVVTVN